MRYDKQIHSLTHVVKNVLGRIEYALTQLSYDPGELVVVNYHGTQRKFLSSFKKQVEFFRSHFSIISPQQVNDYYNNELPPSSKPYLLFTFDDGIKNNLQAAAILDEYNIKALFFIVPDFIDTPPGKQKDFFIRNIRPVINSHIDSTEEDFTAMSWSELRALVDHGHGVGSHTCTHTLVAARASVETSYYEIVSSKEKIMKALGLLPGEINAFCSINESALSTGKKEMELVKKNYEFFYSTYPGSNASGKDPYLIRRSNVESHWLQGAVINAIGKWDRKRWEERAKRFAQITGES